MAYHNSYASHGSRHIIAALAVEFCRHAESSAYVINMGGIFLLGACGGAVG